MSLVVRGSTTTLGMSRYGLASEAYRTISIALWRTFSCPRRAMRSAFRSPGVPSTREAGTASLVGGPSNRPMRAGFAENSFLVIAVPSAVLFKSHLVEKVRSLGLFAEFPLTSARTNRGLCRLAPREERCERLLRIIGPHALREHLVLNFHCLLQLFAESAFHQVLGRLHRSGGLCSQGARRFSCGR